MGSFQWELQIIKVIIGDNLNVIRPNVMNAVTDTGTSSLVLYYEDVAIIQESICYYIEMNFGELENPPYCK